MQLTIHQLDIVVAVIEQRGISNAAFKEELTDHYCCLVESYMSEGVSFEESLQRCVADFHTSDLLEIEKIIVKQSKNKRVIMKNLALMTMLIFMITTTLVFAQQNEIPDLRPVNSEFRISAGFGYQIHPIHKTKRHHDGMDIVAPEGTPVYAAASGKVIIAKDDKNKFGKHVKISHGEYETFYAHLSEITVKAEEQITKGDLIGKVGNTGLSTGPHLHYEVTKSGEKINPEELLGD